MDWVHGPTVHESTNYIKCKPLIVRWEAEINPGEGVSCDLIWAIDLWTCGRDLKWVNYFSTSNLSRWCWFGRRRLIHRGAAALGTEQGGRNCRVERARRHRLWWCSDARKQNGRGSNWSSGDRDPHQMVFGRQGDRRTACGSSAAPQRFGCDGSSQWWLASIKV
jgi:hypothetical protein